MNLTRNAALLIVQYARYHRDPRNIATHLVGIPLIVVGIGVLLSHPTIPLDPGSPWVLSPAWALWAAASLWYVTRGHPLISTAVIAANGLAMALAHWVSLQAGGDWLAWGIGLFVAGWVIQFIGHYYEGRKPAFVDDIVGLLVGPMFVVGEAMMALGMLGNLHRAIDRQAGPVR